MARLYRDYVQPFPHQVTTDVLGNVSAVINPDAAFRFMYAGHMGRLDLGKGPGLSRGGNTNPVVFDMLIASAQDRAIPFQRQATGGKSPTDARVLQELHGGMATGVISVPRRYIHTPSKVVCLDDMGATIDLIHEFCRHLRPDIDFRPV